MRLSYILYSLLLSAWIFIDAPIHNRSRWWALGIFILPILTPYYFVKTRPSNKYWKSIGLWALGFAVFTAVVPVLLPKEILKSTSKISPVSSDLKGEVLSLSKKSGLSATNFQKALNGLNEIRNLDTIPKINEAINTVERVQLLFYQANEDSDILSAFISKNKIQLQKGNLHIFVDMEGVIDETYFTYRKAFREYLNAYKATLEYSRDNFEAIIKNQNPQSENYNQLELKAKNMLDVYNEAYLRHMKFINRYSKEHPALAEFITGARKKMSNK